MGSHIERMAVAHQAAEDEAADTEASMEALTAHNQNLLMIQCFQAMNDTKGTLPVPERYESGRWAVTHQKVEDVLVDQLIEDEELREFLRQQLATSEAASTAEFKVAFAASYAMKHAAGMAEIDFQNPARYRA